MPVGRTGMTGVRFRRLVRVGRRARVTLKHAVARVCFLLRWAQRASVTFTRACGEGFPALLAISGGVNGAGALSLTPWRSRAPQGQNRSARGLSEPIADGRVPQRRFWSEERRGVGAQRRPSLGVPFLFVSFLWASKEKGPACGAVPAFKIGGAPPRTYKNKCSVRHFHKDQSASSAIQNTKGTRGKRLSIA